MLRRALHPFVQIVIDEDHQTILEETPRPDLGYVIPRWVTIGGFSQYAYSPTAIIALPDGRMLQQMTLTLIEIGQKIVDPPMIAVGDAIQGGTNLYAGAINWVDPDYDERTGEVLRPITLNGEGLQWGTEYEEKIERVHQRGVLPQRAQPAGVRRQGDDRLRGLRADEGVYPPGHAFVRAGGPRI